MTIEHGHGNNFENDYTSVAYWYQEEPHVPFRDLPAVEERMPRFPAEFLEAMDEALPIRGLEMKDSGKLTEDERADLQAKQLAVWKALRENRFEEAPALWQEIREMLKPR